MTIYIHISKLLAPIQISFQQLDVILFHVELYALQQWTVASAKRQRHLRNKQWINETQYGHSEQ